MFLQTQFANLFLRSTVCTNLVSPDREPVRRNPKVPNNSMGLPDRKFGNPSKAHHPPPKVPTGVNIFLSLFFLFIVSLSIQWTNSDRVFGL